MNILAALCMIIGQASPSKDSVDAIRTPSQPLRSNSLVNEAGASGAIHATGFRHINPARAKSNYQILCQGCHSPQGLGNNGVPQILGYIGNFLHFPEGRAFLVRVPGVANADLGNEPLAELLNWMILTYAKDSSPKHWELYQAEEVARLRKQPLTEVEQTRKQLITKIEALKRSIRP